jgi:hypothetical protein
MTDERFARIAVDVATGKPNKDIKGKGEETGGYLAQLREHYGIPDLALDNVTARFLLIRLLFASGAVQPDCTDPEWEGEVSFPRLGQQDIAVGGLSSCGLSGVHAARATGLLVTQARRGVALMARRLDRGGARIHGAISSGFDRGYFEVYPDLVVNPLDIAAGMATMRTMEADALVIPEGLEVDRPGGWPQFGVRVD